MGLCESNTNYEDEKAKAKSKMLDNNMQDDHNVDVSVKKLLLLGAGESGKSTLFKQVNTLYGTGFTDEDIDSYKTVIYHNIVVAIKALLDASSDHGGGLEVANGEAKEAVLELNAAYGGVELTPELGAQIKAVWLDPAIQKTYENRSNFQLTDSTKYFLDKIEEVSVEDWLPSTADMLRARVRTTGIIENQFQIEQNAFKMFDVGGQRNERKKWMHCFEDVTAVLFVGVLSEYDLVLYEDHTMNRMAETLNLFENIVNSKWFVQTAMILFLNKRDLFQTKLEEKIAIPLSKSVVFRQKKWNVSEILSNEENGTAQYTDEEIDYMYPNIDTYEGGCTAIESMFLMRNKNPDKQVYVHVTCATDPDNVTFVFDAVKEIVIGDALREAGLYC